MDGRLVQTRLLIVFLLVAQDTAFGQWTPTNGPQGARVFAILANSEGVLIGTDGGGVFSSVNQGDSWVPLNEGLLGKRVRSIGTNGSHMFAGTEIGLFRSLNRTLPWTKVTLGSIDTIVASFAGGKDTLFAGTVGQGAYRSTDGGFLWEGSNAGLTRKNIHDLYLDGEYVVAGTDSGIFVSRDCGLYWTAAAPFDPAMPDARTRVSSLAQMDSLLFASTRQAVHVTLDTGKTWVKRTAGIVATVVFDLLVIGNDIFAATDSGIFFSTNQGVVWTTRSHSLTYPTVLALASFTNIYAGTEGGVSSSEDYAANWMDKNIDLNATRVRSFCLCGQEMFAGTLGSGLFISTNSGGEWRDPVKDDSLGSNQISALFTSGTHVLAGTLRAGIYATSDCGTTWGSRNNGLPQRPTILAFTASGQGLYAGTYDSQNQIGGVYSTQDTGFTWQSTSTNQIDSAVTSLAVRSQELYAGTSGQGVFSRIDNSSQWVQMTPGDSRVVFSLTVAGENGQYLIVGTEGDGAIRYNINDRTEIPISVGLPDTVTDLLRTGLYLIAATPSGIFLSTNDGDQWNDWSQGLTTESVQSLWRIVDTIFAGTYGGGIEKRILPPLVPILVSPSHTQLNQPIPTTFTWNASSRATGYDVQVALDTTFTELAISDSNIQSTTWQANELAHNTQYHWRVRAKGNGGTGPYSTFRSFTTSVSTTFSNAIVHVFPGDPKSQADYRLVSFPGIDIFSAGELLQGTSGTDWRMFEDNGDTPPDHLTELSSDSMLIAGKGYWLLSRDTLAFSRTVTMPPVDNSGNYAVDVDTGWNILGNPFDRALDKDAIRIENSDSTLVFYSYEGGIAFEDTMTLLQPFRGYYFCNVLGVDSLLLPYPFPAQTPSRPSKPVLDWTLRIFLETPGAVDSSCFVGVSTSASTGQDLMDIRKPPMIFQAPGVAFVRPEWDRRYTLFKSDIRPPFREGAVWLFEANDVARSAASLHIEGLENVPRDFQVVVINLTDSSSADCRTNPDYHYIPTGEKSSFKLIVGTRSFVENEEEKTLPVEFALAQNFPNPFNPSTTIRYAIPHEAHVAIEIWSVTGQRVTMLSNDRQARGVYARTWNGLNAQGVHVSSGVYFYRMLIDGSVHQSRKMILIK